MEVNDAKFVDGFQNAPAMQDCGAHGAHLRAFLFFMFLLISLIFLAAKLARDLAILPFSGHDAPKSTKHKTVCFSKLFFLVIYWSSIFWFGHLGHCFALFRPENKSDPKRK